MGSRASAVSAYLAVFSFFITGCSDGGKSGSENSSAPWIMGYYAGYYPAHYPPDKVNVQSMTHVIWARGAVGAAVGAGDWIRGDDQPCYPTTIAVGEWVPPGGVCLAAGSLGNQTLEPIVERAHAAGRKVLIVIGGVGEGPTFVASTATSEVRDTLAVNLLDLLEAYDLDGVDIDWEDEISAERGTQQFIPFVQRLRELAQTRARYGSASPLIVTVPWFTYQDQETAAPDAWIADLAKLVDRVNMMSYGVGIANPWSGWATWHAGALFGPNGPSGSHTTANGEVGSLERAVQQYVDLGIPREKVGIGVGFYGFAWGPPSVKPADQPALGNPAPLSDLGDIDEQTWYKNLPLTQGTYVWDDTAKMGYRVYNPPFVLGAGEQVSWWSYEDERSLATKVDWLQAGNAGSMIIWMINYGCTNPDTGENVLLQAIQNAMEN